MKVKIFIDGERIKLNDFVEQILGNIINGAIESLSDIKEDWRNLEIKVEKG